MKHFIFIILFLIPTINYAQDSVRDLQYFPKQGTLWAKTSYAKEKQETNINVSSVEASANRLDQDFYYIYKEGNAIGVSLTYAPESKNTITNTSTTTYKSKGFLNPTFIYSKRALYQDSFGYNLDFLFLFSPDIFEAKDASTTKDGTVANGRNTLSTSLTLGKKNGQNHFAISGGIVFKGDKEEEAAISGVNTQESNTLINLGAEFQRDFDDFFSIRFGFAYISNGETESLDSSNNKTIIDSYDYFQFSVRAIFQLKRNLALSLDIATSSEYEMTGKFNNTAIIYKDVKDERTTLDLIYQF